MEEGRLNQVEDGVLVWCGFPSGRPSRRAFNESNYFSRGRFHAACVAIVRSNTQTRTYGYLSSVHTPEASLTCIEASRSKLFSSSSFTRASIFAFLASTSARRARSAESLSGAIAAVEAAEATTATAGTAGDDWRAGTPIRRPVGASAATEAAAAAPPSPGVSVALDCDITAASFG